MRGVNKVTILGNCGSDPELKYMPSGKAVCNLGVATSEQWKDKQTGDKKERTEWHSIVFYDKLAEIAAEYLKKGASVYIEGKLRTRKWQDKEGKDRYSTEILANEMQMLGGKAEATGQKEKPPLKSSIAPSDGAEFDDELQPLDSRIPF